MRSPPVDTTDEDKVRPAAARLPANVAALGVVRLLMVASSQMTHSPLPLYLVSVMGAPRVRGSGYGLRIIVFTVGSARHCLWCVLFPERYRLTYGQRLGRCAIGQLRSISDVQHRSGDRNLRGLSASDQAIGVSTRGPMQDPEFASARDHGRERLNSV